MPRTVRITKVDRRKDRTILAYRSGGEKFCFEILGGMKEFREWIEERLPESSEQVVAIGLAQWMESNRGANDFSGVEGLSFTVDAASGKLDTKAAK